jgi:hypothetical protein
MAFSTFILTQQEMSLLQTLRQGFVLMLRSRRPLYREMVNVSANVVGAEHPT